MCLHALTCPCPSLCRCLPSETEIKQLQGWKATVDSLIERFQDGMAQAAVFAADLKEATTRESQEPLVLAHNGGVSNEDGPLAAAAAAEADRVAAELAEGAETGTASKAAAADGESGSDTAMSPASPGRAQSPAANGPSPVPPRTRSTQQMLQLPKLQAHFQKDVRRQLYNETDDRSFFNRIKDELKQVEKRLEDGRGALQHLEMHLINVACDDPGAVIGAQLALPILQERLDAAALEYAAKRAAMAESEIIRMEVGGVGHGVWCVCAWGLVLVHCGNCSMEVCCCCCKIAWPEKQLLYEHRQVCGHCLRGMM